MAAVFKDPFIGLLFSSLLFCVNVSSMAIKSGKLYSASFKNGELRLYKPGKSPITILIPVKRNNSSGQKSSSGDKRPARSPLVVRLLEEREPSPGPSYTQAIFPAHMGASYDYDQPTVQTPDSLQVMDPKYEFLYKVRDREGNNYGHMQSQLGGKTWGEYFVHLPDGRLQTVRYWADHTGYHAEVSYGARPAHGGDDHVYS